MSQIRGISEVVLIVSDVPSSARFYRDVVGLIPESEADEAWAWFKMGSDEHPQRVALHKGSLLFEEQSPLPKGERWGQIHYAFEVDRNELESAVENVRRHDVDVFGPVRLDWMKADAYYFYDPDGNLLEFWSPDPVEATTVLQRRD